MRNILNLLLVAMISAGLMLTWSPAQAQLGGLKKKLEKKAEEKAGKKADEAVDKATGDSKATEEESEQTEQEKTEPTAAGKGGTATAENMTLYTKYDFVPGDKVIFFDDLSSEEVGEFPSRWNLEHGVFLLVVRCSFGDTDHWVSLVRNGHGRRGDHRVPAGAPASRWERHAQPVEAWHNGPRTVLCGQHDAWSPHYATPDAWYEDVRSAATHFRRHPQADNPTGLPDTRGWNGVGQAITLNSSVAIAAVLAGVPTVTMDEGAMAWDVTGHAPGEIIKPPRLPWLHWLAWTQWSHDEVEEGKPWAHLIS